MNSVISFEDFKLNPEFYQFEVENIQQERFDILWFDDFYDGVLSGILEFNNRKFRFEIVTDYTKNIRPRLFAILELSDLEIDEEIYWHNLFEKLEQENDDFPLEINSNSNRHILSAQYQSRPNRGYSLNSVRGWYFEK